MKDRIKHTYTHEHTTTELPLTRRLYALGPPAVVSVNHNIYSLSLRWETTNKLEPAWTMMENLSCGMNF